MLGHFGTVWDTDHGFSPWILIFIMVLCSHRLLRLTQIIVSAWRLNRLICENLCNLWQPTNSVAKKTKTIMKKFLYKNETYQIIGLCMEVHRILGPGLLEVVYKDALEYEFRQNGIPYEREKKYNIDYKGVTLPHYYYADFVVFDDIMLEAKAAGSITDRFLAWTLHYMSLARSPVGLIVNFGTESLQHKRLIL